MRDDPAPPNAPEPDLTGLIGSRICHDLISPVGAIGNGVELLLMEPGGKSPELALIAESVASANARIRFFRLAFGEPGQGQRLALAEVQGLLADLDPGGRLTVDVSGTPDLPRAEARLLCLLVMALESTLAYGGHVVATLSDTGSDTLSDTGSDTGWHLVGHSRRRRDLTPLWDWLHSPDAPTPDEATTPAKVHFALARRDLARLGRHLSVTQTDEAIHLRL